MNLEKLRDIREAIRNVIDGEIRTIEGCRGSSTGCTCPHLHTCLTKQMVELKQLDNKILEKTQEGVQDEVQRTYTFSTEMTIKIKQLKERIQSHVRLVSSRNYLV